MGARIELPDVPVPVTAGRGGCYVGTYGQFRADCDLTPHIALALEAVPTSLGQTLLDLPIMKEHGQHVQIDVTPLRRFEDFATDVKRRLE